MPQIDAIRFRKYKSFGEEYSTIPLKRMTVLIGRNNSGKSSCIDVIEALCKPDTLASLKMQSLELSVEKTLSDDEWRECWGTNTPSSVLSTFLKIYSGRNCIFDLDGSGLELQYHKEDKDYIGIIQNAQNIIDKFLQGINCLRINAERDIIPEHANHSEELSANGTGATSLINHILNHEERNEQLVQHDLLNALNDIMYPDAMYSGITVQKGKNEWWEVYLYEGDKRYALSKMGSGLKTIILVLLNLIIVSNQFYNSYIKEKAVVFAFEELENNLHPALQRRLFDYIDRFSKEHPNTYVFLTTHSHVPINMFADQEDAQILHVTKEGGVSSLHVINDFITKSEVLNDLDVRASDLLQSNGIIWVEGPSDRIYIKRWIEIWGGGDLCEGIDYQFLYYGGRLLSHYSAEEAQAENDLIGILTTNRNSAIVIDSDKRTPRSRINATKQRIQKEFKAKQLFCWITQGKEIENYVSSQAINATYKSHLPQCGLNELFPPYIEKNATTKKAFGKGKVSFASEVVKHITAENSTQVRESDLKQRITELIKTIRGWTPKKPEPDTKSAQT